MEDLKQRQNRALALAGVIQAAKLVKQLAWHGTVNQDEFATSMYSIFQTHAPTVPAVYGEGNKVINGLHGLLDLLADNKTTKKDADLARYTISLLHLERLLMKDAKMSLAVQKGIERAKAQAIHFSDTHENVIANLAGIYTDTLSTLKFRVHITGENTYLSNNNIVNKIRAVLLAGIRSAVLWRQLGGTRWQILFGKKILIQDAKILIKQFSEETSTA